MTRLSPRRIAVALAAWALLAAACTGPVATTTTTTTPTTTATTRPPITTTAVVTPTIGISDERLRSQVPTDPDVTIGALDNGLTYYVRENFRPGGRAQLRLVIDAGSVLEDPDQSGGAHFLEHMLFNGTERFPVNELTRILESFGARFGPDVNAYTSFDETVYELAIPTDEPEVRASIVNYALASKRPSPELLEALHKAIGPSLAQYGGIDAGAAYRGGDGRADPAAMPLEFAFGAVKARLILEGANIPAAPGVEEELHRRGVLVVPDFIANAGGVICASVEYHGGSKAMAFASIEERIWRNTAEVLTGSRDTGCTPRAAAEALAMTRVDEAMALRRFS